MAETSFGLVFGITILLFALAIFLVSLVLYVIYLNCCKKEKPIEKQPVSDLEHVKTDADGASWENPMAEFDEAITYAENSLPRQQEDVPEKIPEIAEPIPEVEPEQTHEIEDENDLYARVREKQPEPIQLEPEPVKLEPEPEVEPEKPKPKVGKLLHRVSLYESTIQTNSLHRTSQKREMDEIKRNSVLSLVHSFRTSGTVLTGGVMPATSKRKSDPPNTNLDSDTGEPLYAVPQKSFKKSDANGHAGISNGAMADGDESLLASPGVPPKQDDI